MEGTHAPDSSVSHSSLEMLRNAVRHGACTVMSGDRSLYEVRGDEPHRYRIRLPMETAARFLRPGMSVIHLADAYVDGEIGFEGDLIDAVRDLRGGLAGFFKGGHAAETVHTPENDEAFVRHHYDLSNDFFRAWLDRRMVYSCAFFGPGGVADGIDRAQMQKLQIICGKLDLPKGGLGPSRARERVLDIGCGWGGLALWMAEHHDVDVMGITLSDAQLEEAWRRLGRVPHDMAERIIIEKRDYRDLEGEGVYDKISSVGMAEHVGRENLGREFFPTAARLLKPGGRYLHHVICSCEGYEPDGGLQWLRKHIFPGGEFSTMGETIRAAELAGLHVRHVADWGLHYARTLRCWYDRFTAKRGDLVAMVGERTARAYELYLAACAETFESGRMTLGQFLFTKNGSGRPEIGPFHEMSFMS